MIKSVNFNNKLNGVLHRFKPMKLKLGWLILLVILIASCRKDKDLTKSGYYSIESSGPFKHIYPSGDAYFPYTSQPRDSGAYKVPFFNKFPGPLSTGLQSVASDTTTVYLRIGLYCENVLLAEQIKNQAGQPSVWISAVIP
jgi:hypothetical protein